MASHDTLLVAALSSALLLAAGCRQQPPPPPAEGDDLVTEEVAPPPDHLVDPTTDAREKRRARSTGGVLPGDFPADLPLPEGATLTNFGQDEGAPWVELTVPRAAGQVRQAWGQQLRRAGWSGALGEGELRKGEASVAVELTASGPSSQLRVYY